MVCLWKICAQQMIHASVLVMCMWCDTLKGTTAFSCLKNEQRRRLGNSKFLLILVTPLLITFSPFNFSIEVLLPDDFTCHLTSRGCTTTGCCPPSPFFNRFNKASDGEFFVSLLSLLPIPDFLVIAYSIIYCFDSDLDPPSSLHKGNMDPLPPSPTFDRFWKASDGRFLPFLIPLTISWSIEIF